MPTTQEDLTSNPSNILQNSTENTLSMASRSPQFSGARELTILMALEGHEPSPFLTQDGADVFSPSISYFTDGRRIMSGFWDNTVRLWDLRTGKEVEQ